MLSYAFVFHFRRIFFISEAESFWMPDSLRLCTSMWASVSICDSLLPSDPMPLDLQMAWRDQQKWSCNPTTVWIWMLISHLRRRNVRRSVRVWGNARGRVASVELHPRLYRSSFVLMPLLVTPNRALWALEWGGGNALCNVDRQCAADLRKGRQGMTGSARGSKSTGVLHLR